jgi:uncharacterized membrane protein YdbT with pleckstrin-like domain
MSYVEQNLITGEKVLYKTGLHWVVLVGPIAAGVLFGLPGLALVIGGIVAQSGPSGVAGFVLVVLAAVCILWGFLLRRATEFAVTNKRVIIKTGMLRRKTFELLLPKVESIAVDEAAFGRMLGYGSVVVRGTGGTHEPFAKVSHPMEFRRQVQQQIESSEQAKFKGQLVAV